MNPLDRKILVLMARIGRATASDIKEELVDPPSIALIWKALDGLNAEGLLTYRLQRHKQKYSLTAKGVKKLAELNEPKPEPDDKTAKVAERFSGTMSRLANR